MRNIFTSLRLEFSKVTDTKAAEILTTSPIEMRFFFFLVFKIMGWHHAHNPAKSIKRDPLLCIFTSLFKTVFFLQFLPATSTSTPSWRPGEATLSTRCPSPFQCTSERGRRLALRVLSSPKNVGAVGRCSQNCRCLS